MRSGQTKVRGVIQNAEYIDKALAENREFLIICDDEKDADSKRVSLFNARRKLEAVNQRKIRIKKQLLGEQWVVKIWKEQQQVLEIIDGQLTEVQDAVN